MTNTRKKLAPLLFVLLFLLGTVYAWLATDGEWKLAVISIIGTLTSTLATVILEVYGKTLSHKITSLVHNPPGTHLTWLADFFCSPKTMERVVNPLIYDMRTEYCDALAENRSAKATWIRIKYCWSFWKALGLHVVVKNLAEIWKIARMR